jgi:phosphate-selective porin OprO/OprP
MNWDCCPLQRLDVGASFDYGYENNPPNPTATGGTPTVLRTNVATNGSLINGVEFMQLKGTVFERGQRALGSLHAAWYYQQLTLISELQGGFDSYTNAAPAVGAASHTRVPISSWYIQGGYFLTGETVTFRNVVKPLRPLTWGSGGYGAVELMGRFNYLALDNRIFTSGMVDGAGGNTWTNRVDLTDLGVNWYPNQWLKCSVLWEHSQFGSAVTFRPGEASTYNDMFWTRMQVWF